MMEILKYQTKTGWLLLNDKNSKPFMSARFERMLKHAENLNIPMFEMSLQLPYYVSNVWYQQCF